MNPILELRDDRDGVPDAVVVYRRVAWDRVGGRSQAPIGVSPMLNSNCFTDYPADKAMEYGFAGPCMSVAIGSVLEELGYEPSKIIEKFQEFGLARVEASALRSLQRADESDCPQGVMLAPTDSEPWHGVVFDLNERPRRPAVRKAIVKVATWEIPLLRSE